MAGLGDLFGNIGSSLGLGGSTDAAGSGGSIIPFLILAGLQGYSQYGNQQNEQDLLDQKYGHDKDIQAAALENALKIAGMQTGATTALGKLNAKVAMKRNLLDAYNNAATTKIQGAQQKQNVIDMFIRGSQAPFG